MTQNSTSLTSASRLSQKFHRTVIVIVAAVATSMTSTAATGAAEPIGSSSVRRMSVLQTFWLLVRCGVLLAIVSSALYILVSSTVAALAGVTKLGCVNAV